MKRISLFAALLALACFVTLGCSPDEKSKKTPEDKAGASQDDDHDHDHDHGDDHADDHGDEDDHQVGPNKGHLHKLTPGDYTLEWVHHKGNHKNDFFLLDTAGKANTPAKVDSFTVTSLVGEGNEAFTMDAVSPDASGAAAQYSLDNQDLSIAMNLGVSVEIKIGDKTYTTKIEAHKPHDH